MKERLLSFSSFLSCPSDTTKITQYLERRTTVVLFIRVTTVCVCGGGSDTRCYCFTVSVLISVGIVYRSNLRTFPFDCKENPSHLRVFGLVSPTRMFSHYALRVIGTLGRTRPGRLPTTSVGTWSPCLPNNKNSNRTKSS